MKLEKLKNHGCTHIFVLTKNNNNKKQTKSKPKNNNQTNDVRLLTPHYEILT